MREYDYRSVFADQIISYISEMRAVGYLFESGAEMLLRFDRFCADNNCTVANLDRETVEAWIKRRPRESLQTQINRISSIRGLAKHIIKNGGIAFVVPPATHTIERYSYQPHIFTEDEMARILVACDSFPLCPASPRRHIVMPMAIRLIYGCALRISEAKNLTVGDVDLDVGTLMIRNTKFNKTRVVPLADGLTQRCRQYFRELLQDKPDDYPFLPSHKGSFYHRDTINSFFRESLRRAKIPHTGYGPRVHDLRHTAACRCLMNWVKLGKDITNCLPYLSAYLGHEDLRGTQHYLRLTAEMYPDVVSEVEKSCSWMIPEVTKNEAN